MDLNLRDKVAVITGGTVGIGLAIAEGLAAEGANLILVGRNEERADDEAARIADRHGIIAMAIGADVATAEGCDAVIKGAIKGFGGAGVLEVVEDDADGTYRAVYTVRFREAVFVLHVFRKKSKRGIATPQADMEVIRHRLKVATVVAQELRNEEADR